MAMKSGRPLKLTDTVIRKYCEARSIGASMEVAALYIGGTTKQSISQWLRVARAERDRLEADPEAVPDPDKEIYLRLLRKAEEADAGAAITWLQVVDKAAQTDAAWALRMLRLRFPEDYTDETRLKTQSVTIDVSGLSNEQLERIINGEDPFAVLASANASASGVGASQTQGTVHD